MALAWWLFTNGWSGVSTNLTGWVSWYTQVGQLIHQFVSWCASQQAQPALYRLARPSPFVWRIGWCTFGRLVDAHLEGWLMRVSTDPTCTVSTSLPNVYRLVLCTGGEGWVGWCSAGWVCWYAYQLTFQRLVYTRINKPNLHCIN